MARHEKSLMIEGGGVLHSTYMREMSEYWALTCLHTCQGQKVKERKRGEINSGARSLVTTPLAGLPVLDRIWAFFQDDQDSKMATVARWPRWQDGHGGKMAMVA